MAITVSTQTEFKDAITAREAEIILTNDITLTTLTTIAHTVDIYSQPGNMYALRWGGTGITNKTMLKITTAITLTLHDIELDGGGLDVTLIDLARGILTVEENTAIRNLYSRSANAGIKVASNGELNLNGGLITEIDTAETVSITNGNMFMRGDAQISGNNANGLTLLNATLTMSDTASITDNNGMQSGSGILCVASTINMGVNEGDAPLIARNSSPTYSGGIYLSTQSTLTMRYNAKFEGNKAETFAPAIGMGQQSIVIMRENARITGQLSGPGAGLWADNCTVFMFDNAAITQNESNGVGGGVYLQNGAKLTLEGNATIDGNKAATNGGGIYLKASSLETVSGQDVLITNNTAIADGGGVYIDENSEATFAGNTIVSGNTAARGNGVFNEGILNVYGLVQLQDGVYYEHAADDLIARAVPEASTMPVVTDALPLGARLQLEESTYIVPANLPLAVMQNSTAYPVLSEEDILAVLPPTTLGEGYNTYLNADASRIMLGLETFSIAYEDLYRTQNPNPLTYTVADLPITLQPPSPRDGYTFAGWVDSAQNIVEVIPVGTTADLSLYATWSSNAGVLSFTSNALARVFNMPQNVMVEQGQSLALPIEVPILAGYIFTTWNTAADGSGATYAPGELFTMVGASAQLYAQWQMASPTVQTISFEGNTAGVSGLPTAVSAPIGEQLYLPLLAPSCPHSSFISWCINASGTGPRHLPGDALFMPSEAVTLYAIWQPNAPSAQYIVNFAPNGMDVTNMPLSIVTQPPSYLLTLPLSTPIRQGYRFVGWNTLPNGYGTQYQPGDTFIVPAAGVTLYAMWQCCNCKRCCHCIKRC